MDFQFSGPVPQNDIMERHKETKNEGGLLQKRKRRKDMKMRKKIIAGLLTATMVLGMSMTAFAADSQGNYPTKPDDADKADVSITNIAGNPDVTLYQIASVEYGPGGVEFVKYNWAAGAEFDDPKAPTANEINEIAQGLIASPQTITPKNTWTAQDVGDTIRRKFRQVHISLLSQERTTEIFITRFF